MSKPVILCVDDENMVLTSLEDQLLNHLGNDYDIELAESGEEALHMVKQLDKEGRKLAVIVSDQLMPKMKGDDLLVELHQTHPYTLKILLTGQATLESVTKAVNEARLFRFLNKPWKENELVTTVEDACRQYREYLGLVEFNELLKDMSRAGRDITGEFNFTRLTEKITESALRCVGADRCFFFSHRGGEVKLETAASSEDMDSRLLLGPQHKRSEFTRDLMARVEEVLAHPETAGPRLASRVENKGNLMGYIYLESANPRARFTPKQREVLDLLSAQAAVALDNADLYAEVENKNRKINENLRYARHIQESIMPPQEELRRWFPDAYVLYKAKEVVSGDFYWWAEEDEKLMIAAVDCTGHGLVGAFMSVIASNLLNRIITTRGETDPEIVLQLMHLEVKKALSKERLGYHSEEMIDMALASINPKTHTLHYAGAHRPAWVLRGNEMLVLGGNKMSIGSQAAEADSYIFRGEVIQLQPGDKIFLFLDGVTDQFGGEDGSRKLSSRRFKELLLELDKLPLNEHQATLRRELETWQGMEELTDDMLVMCIPYSPAAR